MDDLSLILENCDVILVKAQDIELLEIENGFSVIRKIYKLFSNWYNCKKLKLIIRKSADVNKSVGGLELKKIFNLLIENSIVYIFYKGIYYKVPFKTEKKYSSRNLCQINKILPNENLHIQIGHNTNEIQ